MANDTPSDYFVHGWRLSGRIYKKAGCIADVLKRFGPQRRSTLRKIIQEIDAIAVDYRTSLKKQPLKFDEADAILKGFENSLRSANEQWLEKLRPLRSAFTAQRIKMIRRSGRKKLVHSAMASIDFDLVATTLQRIIGKLRDPKKYAAAHHQPGGKSFERAFLWEPFLRLMKKHHVKRGQHGSFSGAIKSLHLALGIDPPSQNALNQMLHDLRQGERSKRGKGYTTATKTRHA